MVYTECDAKIMQTQVCVVPWLRCDGELRTELCAGVISVTWWKQREQQRIKHGCWAGRLFWPLKPWLTAVIQSDTRFTFHTGSSSDITTAVNNTFIRCSEKRKHYGTRCTILSLTDRTQFRLYTHITHRWSQRWYRFLKSFSVPFFPSLVLHSPIPHFTPLLPNLPHFSDNNADEGVQQEEGCGGFFTLLQWGKVCVCVCLSHSIQWHSVCFCPCTVYVLAFIYCPCMAVNTHPEE